jgi:[ribosomal protein S5]-alanine N-acetyltransferase
MLDVPPLIMPAVPVGRMSGNDQPTLDTRASLHLRPWDPADARPLVGAFTDPDIRRWHVNVIDDEDEALQWIESWRQRWQTESDASWAVVDQGTGALLGRVALRRIDLVNGEAECSYWVLPAARHRGVASGATDRMVFWAFDELGLHRLTIVHSLANTASCAVAASIGFSLEGTMTSSQLLVDGWHDTHLHAKVNSH